MALTRRPLTVPEIERVFDLLRLTDRERRYSIYTFGRQAKPGGKREARHTTWISNGSEPIKVGRARHAQLEGVDR